ncbi:poly-gamma-glutamate system protein, partial [bacterium]|nr:poly-gamma-glutamate system protein [bacterium]
MVKIYRPAILSTNLLVLVMVISLGLFYWALTSKKDIEKPYFKEKLKAAELMEECMETLKNYRLQGGVVFDLVNDPNQTALIGDKYSVITTDAGNLDAKLTTTNPNFAALMVQLLHEAGVDSSDWVAVAFTGSMPT